MEEQILKIGNKIELNKIGNLSDSSHKDVYVSQILDIVEEDLIAAMPISEGKIIPLEIGVKLEAFFYTEKGIYKAECNVLDRGKEDNVYVMKLAITDGLKKFQRRQFYRLPCSIETKIRLMQENEVAAYAISHEEPEKHTPSDNVGMIVDISGGGIRMMTTDKYSKDDYIFLNFPIDMNIGVKNIRIMGRVVVTYESLNRAQYYDVRVQFESVSRELRDLIIKYIFEQQRKIQHKERVQ